jgi:tetratricopeptide (TPR) repeat protein
MDRASPDQAAPLTASARLQAALEHYQAGRLRETELLCRQILTVDPDQAAVHYLLGLAYMHMDQPVQAIPHLRAALRRRPDAEAALNLGAMYMRIGQPRQAIARYRAALRLRPDFAAAHNNLAMALLATGQMETGWAEYEWRWQVAPGLHGRRDFRQPQWTGQRAQGCTLLIHAEQGFGDTLQFCRYAALARARGLRVMLEVPAALVRLLRGVSGVSAVIAQGDALPHFDLHCPMLSLPLALGTTVATIPGSTPYLFAEVAATAAWGSRLAMHGTGQRVGLVWAGGLRADDPQAASIDRRRSLALERLAPLLAVPGVLFVSLQKGGRLPASMSLRGSPGPKQPRSSGVRLIDHTGDLHDFADTAALAANLDLVISVDTAVAHLAGALGKPVWLLDRFDHCWRWLGGRRDSPWYLTMRIYRQPAPGDWETVVAEAARDLRELA